MLEVSANQQPSLTKSARDKSLAGGFNALTASSVHLPFEVRPRMTRNTLLQFICYNILLLVAKKTARKQQIVKNCEIDIAVEF